jgi:murein DD-endopeptidase MepM/ murein hydrolase activator NlpD
VPRRSPDSSSPARPLKRHLGVLHANRGLLAFTAFAGVAAFAGLPAAAAALTPTPVVVAAVQTLRVPSTALEPIVERDAFGISNYSVVQWPVATGTEITSYFGYRSCDGCSTDHLGIDFTPGAGTPVPVIADGVVTEAVYEGVYGVHVIVQHEINGVTVSTLYAHMQSGSMTVSVGQQIERGTIVGAVGSTGQSTGPHLHFGVLMGADYVDPYPWLLANVNI